MKKVTPIGETSNLSQKEALDKISQLIRNALCSRYEEQRVVGFDGYETEYDDISSGLLDIDITLSKTFPEYKSRFFPEVFGPNSTGLPQSSFQNNNLYYSANFSQP